MKQNVELKRRLAHIHAESSISDNRTLLSPLILPGTPSEKVFSYVIAQMILTFLYFISAFATNYFT